MRLRIGLIAALVGGIVAVAGTFLPWVTVEFQFTGLPPFTGLDLGGGYLTLAFAWLGLVALAISGRATTALGGVLGALALLSALFTIWAISSLLPPNVLLNALGYGLYLTVVGTSILVLGAVWTYRARKASAALTGSRTSRPTSGLILGLTGGLAVLVGMHLPWVTVAWTATFRLVGTGIGIGVFLTLALTLAGAAALASPRKGAAALGVVLGVLALSSIVLTFLAILSTTGNFLARDSFAPFLVGGLRDTEPQINLAWLGYGLYLSLAGVSVLVLGTAWTFRERRALAARAGTINTDTADGDPPSNSRDLLSQWGGLLPRPFPLRPNRSFRLARIGNSGSL